MSQFLRVLLPTLNNFVGLFYECGFLGWVDILFVPGSTYFGNGFHMAAVDGVFGGDQFCDVIPAGCLGWDLELNSVSA